MRRPARSFIGMSAAWMGAPLGTSRVFGTARVFLAVLDAHVFLAVRAARVFVTALDAGFSAALDAGFSAALDAGFLAVRAARAFFTRLGTTLWMLV